MQRSWKTYPPDGKYSTCGAIYEAVVTRNDNDKKERYIGLPDSTFKTTYRHTSQGSNIAREKKEHNTQPAHLDRGKQRN